MNKIQHRESDLSQPIESLVEQVRSGQLDRRDFLRGAVKAGVSSAIAYSLLGQATATAQNVTTYAVGEESQTLPQPPTGGNPTTTAVGEEHSVSPPTTYAVGEESQTTYSYGEGPPQPTTYAVGEEGQPVYTTKAIGEEQQPNCKIPQPTTQAIGEESTSPVTTYAVGEESTSPVTTYSVGEEGQASTRAYGEEGHVSPPRTGPQPTTWSSGEEGSRTYPTTQAVGEESSGGHPSSGHGSEGHGTGSTSRPRRQIQSTLRNQIPKVWKGFGRW